MKVEIIGSGGCVAIPKPLCSCRVCQEARKKGRPYARFGPAVYIHDIKTLIDTPEDINHSINASQIEAIDNVCFSHMDPDHTLGFRVFEQLRLNWFDIDENRENENPIKVLARPDVMQDMDKICSKYGSYLDYYEDVRHLIKREPALHYVIDETMIDFIPVGKSTVFVIENKSKLVLAPCDCKPFPDDPLFNSADCLIIGNTFVGEKLKHDYVLKEDSQIRKELFSMEEIIKIKQKYKIKKVIVTHLEEDWGKSYDDYKMLESEYEGIEFAYDGMMIEI